MGKHLSRCVPAMGKLLFSNALLGPMDLEIAMAALLKLNSRGFPDLIQRESSVKPPIPGKVMTLIGPRRAGKTWRLHQDRLGREVPTLYINLEDDRFQPITIRELDRLLEAWFFDHPHHRDHLILYLDEIQNLPDWELLVRRLQDTGYQVFLAGSSSKLLYHEVATQMRGRSLPVVQLPFSFKERIVAEGLQVPRYPPVETLDRLGRVLQDHLRFGGFPEVLLAKEEDHRLRILREYLDTILLRDILDREDIRNPRALSALVRAHIASCGGLLSITREWRNLQGHGLEVDKKTLYRYADLLEEAYLTIRFPRWSRSERERERSQPKAYVIDNGFLEVVIPRGDRDRGTRLENQVAIELTRQAANDPRLRISHWRASNGREVDFVIERKGEVSTLIQVCYDLTDTKTRDREIRALRAAAKETGCERLLIITWDTRGQTEDLPEEVEALAAWRWLLEGGSNGAG